MSDRSKQQMDKGFKKRLAHARTSDEEAVIRKEWDAAREDFYATHALSVEQLDTYYQQKLAQADDQDQVSIRLAWSQAKVSALERLLKLSADGALSTTASLPVSEPVADPEADAIEAARRAYGSPAAANGNLGRVASSPPSPIEIHGPRVEVTTTDKESQ